MNEWIEGPPEWTDDESRLVLMRYQRTGWLGPMWLVARPSMYHPVPSMTAERAWEALDGSGNNFGDAHGVQPCATHHMELVPPSIDRETDNE